MKTILVPTDFSEGANNALEYAIQLAMENDFGIILLNVYKLPLPSGEVPMMLVSPHDMLSHSRKRLNELEQSVRTATEGKILVLSKSREGFAAEEIVSVAKDLKTDLIVMGIVGSTSALDILMGSITTAVIKNSSVPVLAVPVTAHYQPVKNIVFAFDYKSEPSETTVRYLKFLSDKFKAELKIINVVDPQSESENVVEGAGLTDVARGVAFKVSQDVVAELDRYLREHKVDWLVMAKHDYHFPENLFHKSVTKRVVFHSAVPILTIHD